MPGVMGLLVFRRRYEAEHELDLLVSLSRYEAGRKLDLLVSLGRCEAEHEQDLAWYFWVSVKLRVRARFACISWSV